MRQRDSHRIRSPYRDTRKHVLSEELVPPLPAHRYYDRDLAAATSLCRFALVRGVALREASSHWVGFTEDHLSEGKSRNRLSARAVGLPDVPPFPLPVMGTLSAASRRAVRYPEASRRRNDRRNACKAR